MDLWNKLDKAEATEAKSFELLPEGKFTAEVSNVTIKDDQDSKEFEVEFTITGPTHAGRKCWLSSKIDETTSDKKLSFIKGQICKLGGVKTTSGNPMAILSNVNGNHVKITIKHTQSTKDPSKIFLNVYVDEMTVPF